MRGTKGFSAHRDAPARHGDRGTARLWACPRSHSNSSACRRPSARRSPPTASTWPCRAGPSTASSDPTAPARRRRCRWRSVCSDPDAGSARVLGVDVWADPPRAKRMLGVLPDGLMLPERLTGQELLTYVGLLRDLDREEVAERSAELLDVLELDGARETLVIEYSSGMRKKIGLAAALIHAPTLLVLDEPFERRPGLRVDHPDDPACASSRPGTRSSSRATSCRSSNCSAATSRSWPTVACVRPAHSRRCARADRWRRRSSTSSVPRSEGPKGLAWLAT